MDRARFDQFTRGIATRQTRRGAVAAILGLALFGRSSRTSAKPGKAKGKGHSSSNGKGHDKGHGNGHACDKICADLACEKTPVPAGEDREFCCKGEFCSCGGDCCQDLCFQTGIDDNPQTVFCCTGPKNVICQVEFEGKLRDTCCKDSCANCGGPGPSGLAGSYRRPGGR